MVEKTSSSTEKTRAEVGGRTPPPLSALPDLDRGALSLLDLQCSAGNQATGRLIRTSLGRVQPKLQVGSPGDAFEREADRVADAVLQGPAAPVLISTVGAVQRQEDEDKEVVQPKEAPGGLSPSAPYFENRVDALRGRGEPLPLSARSFFESRFGQDFGAVRVHTGIAAHDAARAVHARAFTVGSDVVFGSGEYRPETRQGQRLLAHELTHTVQQRRALRIQRSSLSDEVRDAFTAAPILEALLQRLSQADVQAAQNDTDIDTELTRLLATRPDDLWVAQRVRQGQLGQTTGAFGPKVKGKPVARPIQAFFFRGATAQRALVIAGVHGTERQGIDVAQKLIADLQIQQPHYTVIVVPSLFPDNAAARPRDKEGNIQLGSRESGSTPTNRNFPQPSKDLAAARAAGGGTPVDALGRTILPENLLLMELLERFRPERIISIHGTFEAGSAGVFYDPRSLRDDEVQAARQWASWKAHPPMLPGYHSTYERDEQALELEERLFDQRLGEMRQQASDTDRALSLKAAAQIHTATAGISGREKRSFTRGKVDPAKAPEMGGRKAHPSVAGNVGKTGDLTHSSWSGGAPGGVSLGGYAPPRGMSVFTVEPPINRNTGDYPTPLDKITAADRKIELQAYADAVRTVLLGQ